MSRDTECLDELAQLAGSVVRAQQDGAGATGYRGKLRVASNQGASLARGSPQQSWIVSRVIVGRIVPKRAQPAGQASEHDIAEEARGWPVSIAHFTGWRRCARCQPGRCRRAFKAFTISSPLGNRTDCRLEKSSFPSADTSKMPFPPGISSTAHLNSCLIVAANLAAWGR